MSVQLRSRAMVCWIAPMLILAGGLGLAACSSTESEPGLTDETQNVTTEDAAAENVLQVLLDDSSARALVDDINEISVEDEIAKVTVDVSAISTTAESNDACEIIYSALKSSLNYGVEILGSSGSTASRRLPAEGDTDCHILE